MPTENLITILNAIGRPTVEKNSKNILIPLMNYSSSDKNIGKQHPQQKLVNSCLSLMSINISDIVKLLGDVGMLTDLFATDWLSGSMCEDAQPYNNEQSVISMSGFDASIEVGPNRINHLEINIIKYE